MVLIKKALRRFFFGSGAYNLFISKIQLKDIVFVPEETFPGDPALGDNIYHGHFDLRGKKVFFSENPFQKNKKAERDWLDELHSFSWLRHLKAKSGSLARKQARYLIKNWVQNNKNWNEKSWEPYVLAKRISAWLTNIDFLLAEKDDEFSLLLRRNLLKQIKHLISITSKKYFKFFQDNPHTFKHDIRKISIVKGLILGQISFGYEQTKYKNSLDLLEEAIKSNFNNEGVHKTRSPSTQLQVLSDLVTIRESFIMGNKNVPETLEKNIKRIAHSLRFFRSLDGSFATFNGSKKENKTVIDKILNVADGKARARGPTSLFESGFERLTKSNVCVFIDTLSKNEYTCAKSPHSIEISIGKERLIGSCGATNGKSSEWKKVLLSNSANSTLTIDETNAFTGQDKKQYFSSKRYVKNGFDVVECIHHGYLKRFSCICSRTVELEKNGKSIAILDTIHSDKLNTFFIRLHFSPSVKISLSIDKNSALITTKDQGLLFKYSGKAKLFLENSIFVQDSGKIENTSQLVLKGETTNKQTDILWAISKID